MADTVTGTYSLVKPEVGASEDTWGTKINTNLDSIDDLLDGTTAIAPNLSTLTIAGVAVTSTAAELNILDGVTSTAAELNVLDGITATVSELNILDGVTATAAEINVLDGITATVTELNYTDGVTSNIQTQLDAKAALASPALTGTPTAPTAVAATDTTQIATTAFVVLHADASDIGRGQENTDVGGSRANNTSYQNTTGKPIFVSIIMSSTNNSTYLETSTDNSTWVRSGRSSTNAGITLYAVIPDTHYYRINGTNGFIDWTELR